MIVCGLEKARCSLVRHSDQIFVSLCAVRVGTLVESLRGRAMYMIRSKSTASSCDPWEEWRVANLDVRAVDGNHC